MVRKKRKALRKRIDGVIGKHHLKRAHPAVIADLCSGDQCVVCLLV